MFGLQNIPNVTVKCNKLEDNDVYWKM